MGLVNSESELSWGIEEILKEVCVIAEGVKDEKIKDEIFNTFTVYRVVHESFYACAHVILSKTFISHDGLWQRLSVGADVKLLRTFKNGESEEQKLPTGDCASGTKFSKEGGPGKHSQKTSASKHRGCLCAVAIL